jgi:adenine deaminase
MVKRKPEKAIPKINRHSETLVITGVNIIDVIKKTVYENSTIICSGGKIDKIGTAKSLSI